MSALTKNAIPKQCIPCDFICFKKADYIRHTMTLKHINRTNQCVLEHSDAEQLAAHYECKKCLKKYKARNSLWYHERKCAYNETPIE